MKMMIQLFAVAIALGSAQVASACGTCEAHNGKAAKSAKKECKEGCKKKCCTEKKKCCADKAKKKEGTKEKKKAE